MNMVHSGLKASVPTEKDETMTNNDHQCPICAEPFTSDALCADDIDMVMCHAACLEGSPVVNLETGQPTDGSVFTYRYSDYSA